jgi:hypothetical protein
MIVLSLQMRIKGYMYGVQRATYSHMAARTDLPVHPWESRELDCFVHSNIERMWLLPLDGCMTQFQAGHDRWIWKAWRTNYLQTAGWSLMWRAFGTFREVCWNPRYSLVPANALGRTADCSCVVLIFNVVGYTIFSGIQCCLPYHLSSHRTMAITFSKKKKKEIISREWEKV